MNKPWENEDRKRYYGLRRGDIVTSHAQHPKFKGNAEVVGYGGTDNNRVILKVESDKGAFYFDEVAELLTIVTKVEDRNDLDFISPEELTIAIKDCQSRKQRNFK